MPIEWFTDWRPYSMPSDKELCGTQLISAVDYYGCPLRDVTWRSKLDFSQNTHASL